MKRILDILILFSITSLSVLGQEEVQHESASFYQLVLIDTDKYTDFRLTGAIKVEVQSPDGNVAVLWTHIENKDGSSGSFDNTANRRASNEWDLYKIEKEINKESDLLFFGGLVFGSGNFYFDQFHLELRDKSGVWTSLDFKDSSFEAPIEGNKMKHWIEGFYLSPNVRFTNCKFISSTDAYDGEKSLMLKKKW